MTANHVRQCVILFMKTPTKGQVKTRLASVIGDDVTLELYRAFVKDAISTVSELGPDFLITYYPPSGLPELRGLVGSSARCLPQHGEGFGDRLLNSFLDAFSLGYSDVILAVCDSPDLPASIFRGAFEALSESDAVVGPGIDGGYYLIGFKRSSFLPEAFAGIKWSTSEVFPETMSKIKAASKLAITLQPWGDVDTLEDLKALAHKLERKGDSLSARMPGSNTRDFLRAHRSLTSDTP